MDVVRTHSPGIQGDNFLLNAGNIPLVFRNKFGFKLPIAVPGNIYLKFPILAFESLRGMTVTFIGGSQISLLIFSYPRESFSSASISSWRISLKLSLRREWTSATLEMYILI